jgi:tetratricopeptide (TPR) repeat protein
MLPSKLLRHGIAVCAGLALTLPLHLHAQAGEAPAAEPEAPTAPAAAAAKGHEVAFESLELRDRIGTDGVLVRTQRTVARMLTAAGVAGYSQIGVPFLESNQKAELTALRITGPDGTAADVLGKAPVDVTPVLPPGLPIHSDLRMLRAAVPSLAVGDVLSWETRVRVEPLVDHQVWTEASFQDPEEVPSQLYELDVPEGSPLIVHVRSGFAGRFEEEKKDGRWIRRWRIGAAPESEGAAQAAAQPEKVAPASDDGRTEPDVQVTSFASWQELGDWWASLAPPVVDAAVAAKAKELVAGARSPEAKLGAIERFVAQRIRYLALPIGLGRFQARTPDEILATGMGDCKDKVRLLASLAESVGIRVDPLLISATHRRLVDDVPSPLQFDHVIARAEIGGRTVWMDPTSEMTPMGSLEKGLRGTRALALAAARGGGTKVSIAGTPEDLPFESSQMTETKGSIDTHGIIRVTVRWTFHGDDELVRLASKYSDEKGRRRLAESLRGEWEDKAKIGDPTTGDPDDLATPFWIEFPVDWEMSAAIWKKAWTFWVPVPDFDLDQPPDPAADEPARGPSPDHVDLTGAVDQVRSVRIELPEGVSVSPPVPVTLERPFADYRSEYGFEGHTLTLRRELHLKVKSVPATEFGDLKAFAKVLDGDRTQEFAIAAAPQLAPVETDTADSLNHRCWEAMHAGHDEEAEKLCRKATELDPEHGYAWNNLGLALIHQRRYAEAEKALQRQLEINPNDEWAYANLGWVAWDRGDLPGAEKMMRKQIEVAPLNSAAHESLGELLSSRQKWQEAETMLLRALKLEPGQERAEKALINLYARSGQPAKARDLILEHPNEPDDLQQLVGVAGALLASGVGPWAPLSSWVERLEKGATSELVDFDRPQPTVDAVAAVSALGLAWDATGRIALEHHQPEEAARRLRAAVRLMLSSRAAERLSVALRALGRNDEADLELAVATMLNPSEGPSFEKELERQVPSGARRSALLERAREESWKLRALTRKLPAAAGTQGAVWLLFGADGRLMDAATVAADGPKALVASLKKDPPTISLPQDNRARIPLRAQAFCSASGECTMMLDPPYAVWYDLSRRAEGSGN